MTLSTTAASERFATHVDLFTPESLAEPYGDYRKLREVGPIAYMPQYDTWVLARYDEVRRGLEDWQTFSSAGGLALNDHVNEAWKDMMACKDGAAHKAMRQKVIQTFSPKAINVYRGYVEQAAAKLVEEVAERREFDAVVDFAQLMPIRVFLEVLGIDPDLETRYNMLHWATDVYHCIAPEGRYEETLPSVGKLYDWAVENITREKTKPKSIGSLTWEQVGRGELTEADGVATIAAMVTAGLDTTAGSLGNIMAQFIQNPDQYATLRDEPTLLQSAFFEGVRIDSVAQWLARQTTRDIDFNGAVVPAGARVMMMYGAANRDERHYENPDRFDVRRNPTDHLAMGAGPHSCIGRYLASMEMVALISELIKRIDSIELTGEPRRHLNNSIRSYESLPVRVHSR